MQEKTKDDLSFAAILVLLILAAAAVLMLVLSYNAAVGDLEKMRGERAAVADVERFIHQRYPAISAAERRGHAELLLDPTCVKVVENASACPGGGITKHAADVRSYADWVVAGYGR